MSQDSANCKKTCSVQHIFESISLSANKYAPQNAKFFFFLTLFLHCMFLYALYCKDAQFAN